MTDSTSDTGSGEGVSKERGAEVAEADSLRQNRDPAFWSSLSLTALAEAQGVAPAEDPGSIAALWPADDDPDELLAFILAERAASRRVTKGDAPR